MIKIGYQLLHNLINSVLTTEGARFGRKGVKLHLYQSHLHRLCGQVKVRHQVTPRMANVALQILRYNSPLLLTSRHVGWGLMGAWSKAREHSLVQLS